MDFSELVKCAGLATFSPDGEVIAATDENRIHIRDSSSLSLLHSFTCLDLIASIQFSPDSCFILATQPKRRIVQVFCVRGDDEEEAEVEDEGGARRVRSRSGVRAGWSCKIDEALAGLAHAEWAPDSRHILTRSEFNLRLSIWSLVRKNVVYIKYPKLMPSIASRADPVPGSTAALAAASSSSSSSNGSGSGADTGGNQCVRFSHSGRHMCVVTRHEGRDWLSIYSVGESGSQAAAASVSGGWELIKQFSIDTEDVAQVEWSPDDSAIICVDTPLQYKICIYTPSGQRLSSYSAYSHALGVKCSTGRSVAWSPCSSFLAVGSFDGTCRIFNTATQQIMVEYAHSINAINAAHSTTGAKRNQPLVIYVEKPLNESNNNSHAAADDKENLDETSAVGADESFAGDLDASMRSTLGALRNAAGGPASTAAGTKKKNGAATARSRSGSISARGSASTATGRSGALTARGRSALGDTDKITLNIPSKYTIGSLPLSIPTITPPVDKADPRMGIGLVSWSVDSRFLLTRLDQSSTTLWIWDTKRLSLSALLIQMESIRCAEWDPVRPRLALATSNAKLYLWAAEGCSIVDVPLEQGQHLQVKKIEWSKDGKTIMLMDKNKFCCCYMKE